MQEQCCVCGKPAVVVDTEYEEFYCEVHGETYEVFAGPHRRLDNGAAGAP